MGKRRNQMSEGKKNIIAALLQEYDIKSAEDIQDALKDLLGGTIHSMMKAEMDQHLGYEPYECTDNINSRRRIKESISIAFPNAEYQSRLNRKKAYFHAIRS